MLSKLYVFSFLVLTLALSGCAAHDKPLKQRNNAPVGAAGVNDKPILDDLKMRRDRLTFLLVKQIQEAKRSLDLSLQAAPQAERDCVKLSSSVVQLGQIDSGPATATKTSFQIQASECGETGDNLKAVRSGVEVISATQYTDEAFPQTIETKVQGDVAQYNGIRFATDLLRTEREVQHLATQVASDETTVTYKVTSRSQMKANVSIKFYWELDFIDTRFEALMHVDKASRKVVKMMDLSSASVDLSGLRALNLANIKDSKTAAPARQMKMHIDVKASSEVPMPDLCVLNGEFSVEAQYGIQDPASSEPMKLTTEQATFDQKRLTGLKVASKAVQSGICNEGQLSSLFPIDGLFFK